MLKLSPIHILILLLLAGPAALAQSVGQPWRGASGITETVEQIMAREQQLTAPIGPPHPTKPEVEANRFPRDNPDAPKVAEWPPLSQTDQSGLPAVPETPQAVGLSFLAIQLSESGFIPPDCNGAVSETQILTINNGRIKIFSKSGALGALNVSTNNFFSSVRNGSTTSDPHVRYDRISGRWFIVMINVAASSNRVLLAVSNSSTITSGSSFTFFQFTHDQVGSTPNNDTGLFADYPTLGVDANAVYIGVNIFNTAGDSVKGTTGFVLRKSDLLSGGLTVTAFRALTNGVTAGPWTPQGVDNDDPTATEGYFIGVDWLQFSLLDIRRVSDPGGTPTISGNIGVTVPETFFPINQVHAGAASNRRLDALDDRLFAAQIKKNDLTGVRSLWTAHNMRVGTNGVAGLNGTRNASRWYELRNMTSTPVLFQSGTLYDPSSTNPRGYWIPSVAASGQGHMALGSSYASAVDFAGIAVSGRLSGDATGTTRSPTLAVVSTTSYNVEATDGQRWGDFSQVVVDPSDDMTMWTFQEYCNTQDSWGMRVVKLLAPLPATPASCVPESAEVATSNLNVTVTGAPSGGSAFFDPGGGFPRHISATVNGGGVTVNTVTFVDSTHVIVNLSIAGNAPPGPRTITVMNPDSQTVTSASGIFTITNANCPAITLAPVTLPSGVAGFSYSQLITASGGTAPYTYSVTSGALPLGVTLSASGLLSGTPPFGGTYNFGVTASDSAFCPGSRAYSWTVTGCPQITVSPATLPDGVFGAPYNQTLTSSGGTGPYTYAVTIGTLPTGLSLAASGAITGTPTALGAWDFTVTATDAGACTGNRAYTISVASSAGGNTVLLSALDVAYTQNFNTLVQSGTSSALPTGWLLSETGSNANTLYSATDGTANTGDTYSFGTTGSGERAFGGLQSGTLTPTIGVVFTNISGAAIASLDVHYTGEQWRLGAINRVDRMDFQMSTVATNLTTGPWTDVDSLDFTAPVTTGPTGPLNGNANQLLRTFTITGLNVPNGGTFFFRWLDFNASTADDGLAVDDFSLTPHGVIVPTNPAGAGIAVPETLRQGEASLLQVTVTPGTNPTSTGIAVTADLSSINGSPAQQFFDDGTHGDGIAGDKVFSYLDTIPLAAATGSKSLPVTLSDAQARAGSAAIHLFVKPACAPITLTAPPLPDGEVGVAYNQQLVATGGASPYSYVLGGGSLPPGMFLSSGGLLYGVPLASDSFSFTVTVHDFSDCPGSQTYDLVIVQGSNLVVNFALTGFWNLLSNPVVAANDSVQSLFPNAASGAFEFVPGSGYQLSSLITNGKGFWLKFGSAETLHIVGEAIVAETLDVADGWNLFGSITNPVPVAALSTIGTGITSDVYGYSNGYQVTDTVRPARGHWAKFSSPGKLVLGNGPAAFKRAGAAPEEIELALTLTDHRQRTQTLLLLAPATGSQALARYELPPAPPQGSFDVRFASQRRGERSPGQGRSAEYAISLQDLASPLTVRWSRLGAIGQEISLAFPNEGSDRLLLAGAAGEAIVRCDSPASSALLHVGTTGVPLSFALYQNYPNPFNPATVIGFVLKEPSLVSLTIINVLGEVVGSVISKQSMEAGVHEVRFESGVLPSGIYYYRLNASPHSGRESFSETRKMILVR